MTGVATLPNYGSPDRHRQVVPRARRQLVEYRDDQGGRVLHIVETGMAPVALRDYAETAPLVQPVGPCGVSGDWTLTPQGWRLSVVAAIGDVLEWAPNVHLGGGPAAFDVASVIDGEPARWKSTGLPTPLDLGSMYVQGDYGTAGLPTVRWMVQAADLSQGRITLVLGYRDGTDDADPTTLGHTGLASWISVVNHGPVERIATEDIDPTQVGTQIYLGTGDPTMSPGGYRAAENVAIDVQTLDIYQV